MIKTVWNPAFYTPPARKGNWQLEALSRIRAYLRTTTAARTDTIAKDVGLSRQYTLRVLRIMEDVVLSYSPGRGSRPLHLWRLR